jgi:hypothetical protein
MEKTKLTAAVGLAIALLGAIAATSVFAQQPQTMRLRGVIDKLDGRTVLAKSAKGDALKLMLADKVLVVAAVKATAAEIKEGSYIGSGATPQADGTQKAVEVHVFAESMRGTGEGFRPWDGAPNSTMTNGTVGAAVTGVDGPVVTIKYKDGEQKIVVTPNVPIVRYEIADVSAISPGAPFSVTAAVPRPDGGFDVNRINVGRGGASPP